MRLPTPRTPVSTITIYTAQVMARERFSAPHRVAANVHFPLATMPGTATVRRRHVGVPSGAESAPVENTEAIPPIQAGNRCQLPASCHTSTIQWSGPCLRLPTNPRRTRCRRCQNRLPRRRPGVGIFPGGGESCTASCQARSAVVRLLYASRRAGCSSMPSATRPWLRLCGPFRTPRGR